MHSVKDWRLDNEYNYSKHIMNKYLVTGAAGFIGANFVKYLLGKWGNDIDIMILDNLTYAGNLATISTELEKPNVRFVKGNISDNSLVKKLVAEYDPDFIVNFAAETHVDRSINDPRTFLETNILGTQALLDAAKESWLCGKTNDGKPVYREGKKYLQISTDEVYGSLARDFDTPRPLTLDEETGRVATGRSNLKSFGHSFFKESTPLSPRSPYSASKASADMLVEAYHETYGLPVNITRCSNNYGPAQFPEKLIPLIFNNVLKGKPLPVYGKGENVRDWLYVDDHCSAIDLVLRNGRDGEVYNIGGFNEEQNITIVKTIIDIMARLMQDNPEYRKYLEHPLENVNHSMITFVGDRPGHDMRYAIDPAKIATELGWYPETPFTKGIEKTIRWYFDNHEWIENVTSGDYLRYYEKMYSNR